MRSSVMGRALQSTAPMAHNAPRDAIALLSIACAGLIAACPYALTGQSVEEWGVALGQKYTA